MPPSAFDPRINDPVTGQPLHKLVNINNAQSWTLGHNIEGWKCTEIRSNMDAGTVTEFIKKEGKWFNYIKGSGATAAPATSIHGSGGSSILDPSRFSVQGVGVVSNVTSLTITP